MREESLVEMIVAVHDDVHAVLVQRLPDIAHQTVGARARARREERMVPVRQRALRRLRAAVRIEVVSQSRDLRPAVADADVAVERNDVPVAERVAVVSRSHFLVVI